MNNIFLIILLICGCNAYSQNCRFIVEENTADPENRKIQTNSILIDGIVPNNLSLSFLQNGEMFYINIDYLFLDNSGISINRVSLPTPQFPKINNIDSNCNLTFVLMNGQKITLKIKDDQTVSKRNLTKSSIEFKIKDLNYVVLVKDLQLIQNEIIDKLEIQYFKQDNPELQIHTIQVSENRDKKIKNVISCLLNY